MKIKIVLSTGKEIELTPEETNELFAFRKQGVAYVPYIQTVPEWWPNYTVTCASPNPGGGS